MGKRLKNYLEYMDKMTGMELTEEDRKKIKEDLLVQISFFQHERLIHLIVTVTFAILTILTFLSILVTEQISLWMLFALLVVLLVPYIAHYYKLENGVQKLYEYYDRFTDKPDARG